jgi:HrpA-like RNA helicase
MSDKLPTLLRSGFVIPPNDISNRDKEIINKTVSVDYILKILADMIPMTPRGSIKNAPQKPGDKYIVLKADTGSGKSTVLPAKLYTTLFERTRKNIIVTQPRILTAMDIPSTITPFNPTLTLGQNIGYNTGPFKLKLSEKGIIFSTIGVLSEELIMNTDEEFMKKYQFIIIDEIHERDLETDKCLYLLKKLITANYKNAECPLIILMSATFNENIFLQYFDIPIKNYIQVIGSTFPIEVNFPEFSIINYIKYASLKAQKLHLDNFADLTDDNEFKDIIIFVKDSGIGKKIYDDMHLFNSNILTKSDQEIKAYNKFLGSELETLYKGGSMEKNHYILPILLDTRSFSSGGLEYQNLFSNLNIISTPLWKVTMIENIASINMTEEPINHVTPSRRVIIATNLAETGVTISTLKYCIDTGYHLSSEFYPEYGCVALISKNVSRGSAIQRKGRVGRKSPGSWYPCYTKATFDALPSEQLANVLVNDTTDTLLSILIKEKNVTIEQEYYASRIKDHDALGMFQMHKMPLRLGENWHSIKNEFPTNIAAIDFIELPSIQSLNHSIEKLHVLGFIDDNYDITVPGFYANKFRFISLDSRKMILSGYYYGANVLDLITLAAFIHISKRKIFTKKFKISDFSGPGSNFDPSDDFINCIFVYNIYQKFIENLKKTDLSLDKIRKYCTDNEIIFTGLIQVIETRDIIIENMIDIGLDPYYNGLDIPKYNLNGIKDKKDEIQKLKNCIYNGYRCNLLANENKIYLSQMKGIQIKVKSAIIADLPKYIVVDSYSLSQKFGSEQYEFIADGFVSALDKLIIDAKFYLY